MCALLRGGAKTAIDKKAKECAGQSGLPKENVRALPPGGATTAIGRSSKGMCAGQRDLPKESMRALLRGGANMRHAWLFHLGRQPPSLKATPSPTDSEKAHQAGAFAIDFAEH